MTTAISLASSISPFGDFLDHPDPYAFGRLIEQQQLGIAEHRAADRQHFSLAA